ncbi:MAG: hypothetical protein AVDCRST_MAG64-1116 [uncultured Phycisphaerae bacterium]|uniref:Putative regulatory protein FmdB zinc ribbon domain-containing protein n=1 Tax=uncultured Phycisphaerae bacterium TaxID=904963 RepID=A0A6J4NH41_9BACT|nr:MAG: hypothetical protein AVDCRST_MAG64-1116 [uncultured Phycisphaerae bacterium]
MPLYEFECARHGAFTLVRPMSESGRDGPCPTCDVAGRRVINPPTLLTMGAPARDAAFRNERSRHEPRVSRSGCAHASPATKAADRASAARRDEPPKPKLQAYAGPRPWVVEHR